MVLPSIMANQSEGISPDSTRAASTFPGSTQSPNFMPAACTASERFLMPCGNFSLFSS